MTRRLRRPVTETSAVSYGPVMHREPPFCPGDGRVGGYQATSAYCAEPGCSYVFISVVPITSRPRCPKHKR